MCEFEVVNMKREELLGTVEDRCYLLKGAYGYAIIISYDGILRFGAVRP